MGRENVGMKKHIVREVDLVTLCFCVYSETTFKPHLLSFDNTFNIYSCPPTLKVNCNENGGG